MKLVKYLALALILAAFWTGGAQAWDTRFEVYADSTMNGMSGFLVFVDVADGTEPGQSLFVTQESGQLRIVGLRTQGEVGWIVLPFSAYLGPAADTPVGDTWQTLPDDLGRPSYSTYEELADTTVPAGTFSAARCVARPYDEQGQGFPISEERYFVAGVGMIWDNWLITQDEEKLLSYNIVGGSGDYPLAVGNWWEFQYIDYSTSPVGETPGPGHLLLGNYPNPFNPSTEIAFEMARPDHARLNVYDIAGNLVRTLVDGPREAGRHTVTWNGRDNSGGMAAAGVYLYRFEAGESIQTRRTTLVK